MEIASREAVANLASKLTPDMFASVIDQTNLSVFAGKKEIFDLVNFGEEIGSYICILPRWLRNVSSYSWNAGEPKVLRGIIVVSADFPFGGASIEQRVKTNQWAFIQGADEIDCVVNHALIRAGEWGRLEDEMDAVHAAARELCRILQKQLVVKWIKSNCYFASVDSQMRVSNIIAASGRKHGFLVFDKSNTGFEDPKNFPPGRQAGATCQDAFFSRQAIGEYDPVKNNVGIKMAGGIKDAEFALQLMIAAGVADLSGNLKVSPENLPKAFRIGASFLGLYDDFIKKFKI